MHQLLTMTDLLNITSEATPTYTRVSLEGEIDAGTSRALDAKLSNVLSDSTGPVVIDLQHVNYVSSAGIGIFIYFYGEFNKSGRKLILMRPNPVVHEILTLLRLEEHIPIRTTEEGVDEALQAV